MCGVSLASSPGSPFCVHVIIASDEVILTGVQRSSLARIDSVCGGEPGDKAKES